MKLKNCHIDGFGCLVDQHFEFDDLNSFFEDNGWGKTTFCYFIFSMFYSLKTKLKVGGQRVKVLDSYKPWNNQAHFGGYLIFSFNNKDYKIIKDFKNKTTSIIDLATNLETKDFKNKENLGEEVFKLDFEDFRKLIFIDNSILKEDLEITESNNLNGRISQVIGKIADVENYKDALEKLKALKKDNNVNSSTSFASKLFDEISSLKREIYELSQKESLLNEKQEDLMVKEKERLDLDEKLKALEKKIEKAQLEGTILAKQEENKRLLEKIEEDKKEKSLILELLGGKEISKEEVLALDSLNKEIDSNRSKLDKLYYDEKKLTQELEKITFKNPSDEEYNLYKNKVHELEKIRKEDEEKSNLTPSFKRPYKKLSIILGVASIVLLLGGLITFVILYLESGYLIPTIILSSCGLLSIILISISFILYNKKIKVEREVSYSQKYIDLLQELSLAFKDYKEDDEDFNSCLIRYSIDLNTYKNNKSKLEETKRTIVEVKDKSETLEKELQEKLSLFTLDEGDYSSKIEQLKERSFKLNELNRTLEREILEQKTFEEKNKTLLESKIEEHYNLESLNEERNTIKNELNILQREINSLTSATDILENELSKIDDLKIEIEEKENKLKACKEKVIFYDKAIEYLSSSYNDVQARFIKPIKDNLNKYLDFKILDKIKDFNLTSEYELKFNPNNGSSSDYTLNFLSSGYSDIMNLVIRLALIDSIFKDNKPFVIFDDPLINLDQEKIDLYKGFIKEYSSTYQVLYFTCHESRSLN